MGSLCQFTILFSVYGRGTWETEPCFRAKRGQEGMWASPLNSELFVHPGSGSVFVLLWDVENQSLIVGWCEKSSPKDT